MKNWEQLQKLLVALHLAIDGHEGISAKGRGPGDWLEICEQMEKEHRAEVDELMGVIARCERLPLDFDERLFDWCDLRLVYGAMLAHQFHWLYQNENAVPLITIPTEVRLRHLLIDTWPSYGLGLWLSQMKHRAIGFKAGREFKDGQ